MLEKLESYRMDETPYSDESPVKSLETEKKEKVEAVISSIVKKEDLNFDRYSIETLSSSSPDLTPDLTEEMADFFRYTFNNAFPEYLVCTKCNFQLAASEVFGIEGKYVPLEQLDSQENKACCPGCNQKMELFHDKNTVFQKIQENLKNNAVITLLRDNQKNKELAGMTFGYFDTFDGAFKKEWSNKYVYMEKKDDLFAREKEGFLKKINETLATQNIGEISLDSNVFCWNCTTIRPEAQGLDNLLKMTNEFFMNLPQDKIYGFFVFETQLNSTAHKLLKIGGAIDIPNVFDNDYQVFMSGELQKIAHSFSLSKRDFLGLRRNK